MLWNLNPPLVLQYPRLDGKSSSGDVYFLSTVKFVWWKFNLQFTYTTLDCVAFENLVFLGGVKEVLR